MSNSLETLLKQIAAGKLAPVYVLYGNEIAMTQRVLQAIRKAVLASPANSGASLDAFNYEQFDGSELRAIAPVLEACEQIPMMSARRLVELANPDAIGGTSRDGEGKASATRAELQDALVAYMQKPNPSTVLVLYGNGIDGRSKLVNAGKKHGEVYKFEELSKSQDAVSFVLSEAKAQKIAIANDAAQMLVELVGGSQSRLLDALQRLSLYAGEEATIQVQDIEKVVAQTREAVVFELSEAVGHSDAKLALELLARMFAFGERNVGLAQQLLSLLIRHFRLLFLARVSEPAKIAALAGVPPFVAKKLLEQARGFCEEQLQAAYAGLAQLDRDLKGDSYIAYVSPYIALQRWILRVCDALPGVEG